MTKTDIVILNWNGRLFLEKYLPALLDSVRGMDGIEIVVADNDSKDDSIDFLKSTYPEISIIRFKQNYGFAEGYNRALKELKADYFLLLNSDVEVACGWLEPLVEWMDIHSDCGICGPKLHCIDKADTFEYAGAAGGYIDRLGYPFCRGRVMDRLETDCGQYDIPAEVLWVSGAALMVRSSVFSNLGGFWAPLFAHMEEIDLCWRARAAGWKVHIVPRSAVQHVGGGSLPKQSAYKLFLNHRNNLLLMWRNLPRMYALDLALYLLDEVMDEDDGPDIFEVMSDTYMQQDRHFRKELCQVAAKVGITRTESVIRKRMILDVISGLVYFIKGHPSYLKAVFDAHKGFRKMRGRIDSDAIRHFLDKILSGERLDIARVLLSGNPLPGESGNSSFGLKGLWNKWIVWQSITKKDAIFAEIKEELE